MIHDPDRKTYYPWYYTDSEGGNWQIWGNGLVNDADLLVLFGSSVTVINGVTVYALAFENPDAGIHHFPRWDSQNGWTTTIEQAKQNFPAGRHGEVPTRNRKSF